MIGCLCGHQQECAKRPNFEVAQSSLLVPTGDSAPGYLTYGTGSTVRCWSERDVLRVVYIFSV